MYAHRQKFVLAMVAGLLVSGHTIASEDAPKIKHYENAQDRDIALFTEEQSNVFFEDIVASDDPDAPIACAFFRIEQGEPLTYTYTYDEAKIILEGQMTIDDGQQKVKAEAGDVVFLPEGVTVTFSSQNSGTAFTCGQREGDSA